jgi:hypothetical protein
MQLQLQPLPIAYNHCLLPIAYCLLPTAYCLLPTTTAYCLQPLPTATTATTDLSISSYSQISALLGITRHYSALLGKPSKSRHHMTQPYHTIQPCISLNFDLELLLDHLTRALPDLISYPT